MSDRIKEEVIRTLFHLQIRIQGSPPQAPAQPGLPGDAAARSTTKRLADDQAAATAPDEELATVGVKVARPQTPRNLKYSRGEDAETRQPVRAESAKIGRNAPCPCGSGKKYKKCHGARMPSGA